MNGWRGNYIRAFMAMIGLALVFAGITASNVLEGGLDFGSFLTFLGVILLLVVGYLLYRDFQQKP